LKQNVTDYNVFSVYFYELVAWIDWKGRLEQAQMPGLKGYRKGFGPGNPDKGA